MMKVSKPSLPGRNDRRSQLDRRWIKAKYRGEERRSGSDRRLEIKLEGLSRDLTVAKKADSKKLVGLETLLVSNTIQLEAVKRLLLEKGLIEEDELLAMMRTVQAEFLINNAT